MYFVTGLNLGLQQPLTAALAKTKADIAKKSSYCYLSHCPKAIPNLKMALNFRPRHLHIGKNIVDMFS